MFEVKIYRYIGFYIAFVVSACLLGVCIRYACRKPAVPPAAYTLKDTVELRYLRSEVARLRAELQGRKTIFQTRTVTVPVTQYLVDTVTRRIIEQVTPVIEVARTPRGVEVATYDSGVVTRYSLPVWRRYWRLVAGYPAPSVFTSAIPFDFGFACGIGVTSPVPPALNKASPNIWVRGDMYSGRFLVTGGVEYEPLTSRVVTRLGVGLLWQ